jgi:glycolate oxidase FAD binding subunit
LQLGQQLGLQGAIYSAGDEANLWQKLQQQISASSTEPVITCKIGVLPSAAVATLTQLDKIVPQSEILIHSGSGLGLLRFEAKAATPQRILEMRSCQSPKWLPHRLRGPRVLKATN